MPALNKVQLIGRVGKQPEIKDLGSSKVAKFSLAISEKYKGEERTEWQNIVVWNKTAEYAEKYVSKGSLIYLEGKIQTKAWDDKNGNKRFSTEILCFNLQSLDSKNSEHRQKEHHNTEASAPDVDDLPF